MFILRVYGSLRPAVSSVADDDPTCSLIAFSLLPRPLRVVNWLPPIPAPTRMFPCRISGLRQETILTCGTHMLHARLTAK